VKICYLCHADNYHIKKWAHALANRGHELHLITFRPYQYDHPKIFVHCLESIFKRIYYFDFIAIVPAVRKLLDQLDPNVTIASFANTYGLTAQLADARPRIIQTWSRDIAAPDSVSAREDWMAKNIGKCVLERADAITTDSHNFAELLSDRWPELGSKILPTPWGIETKRYEVNPQNRTEAKTSLGIPIDATVVTSIRGVYWYYNPELLLSALLQLLSNDQCPDNLHVIVLTLAHPRTSRIQELLDKLAETNRVHLLDRYLPYEELYKVWAASDFFISIPKFDGVSEALQEGRMAGAIPILNDIPANREVADEGKHALYVHANAPEQLADQISAHLSLPEADVKRMRQANKKWVMKHANIDQTLDRLQELFERLTNRGSS
jgi:glycosyltransferase involved in cell wall biosynthesis